MADYNEQFSYDTDQDVCIEEPSMYCVFLLNDDYTTMEFVVKILVEIFRKSLPEAESIMLKIHRSGKGLCGTYVREVAETKVMAVKMMAAEAKYPLRCTMEEAI